MIPEFSRPVPIDLLGPEPHTVAVEATEAERKALAKRFAIPAIHHLASEVGLTRSGGEIVATGKLAAIVLQSCVATAVPVEAAVAEQYRIVFRPQPARASDEDEIELSDEEMDVVFYDGASIDIGEAVAETLSLSLDPYPRAPDADALLREAGVKSEAEAGPFAALAALKDKLKP